jgi:predicted oxidoreductase
MMSVSKKKADLQSIHDFERVIGSPLEPGIKRTDHDDTKGEATSEETPEAKLLTSLRKHMQQSSQLMIKHHNKKSLGKRELINHAYQ